MKRNLGAETPAQPSRQPVTRVTALEVPFTSIEQQLELQAQVYEQYRLSQRRSKSAQEQFTLVSPPPPGWRAPEHEAPKATAPWWAPEGSLQQRVVSALPRAQALEGKVAQIIAEDSPGPSAPFHGVNPLDRPGYDPERRRGSRVQGVSIQHLSGGKIWAGEGDDLDSYSDEVVSEFRSTMQQWSETAVASSKPTLSARPARVTTAGDAVPLILGIDASMPPRYISGPSSTKTSKPAISPKDFKLGVVRKAPILPGMDKLTSLSQCGKWWA